MPAPPNLIDLRRMLAERFPAAHRPLRLEPDEDRWSTGVDALDEVLGGGLPRGELTELVGDGPGSGSAQVIHALLEHTARQGRFLTLIDGADSLDIEAPTEEALARLLWVRCRSADEALRAADLVLRDRNLPLVVIDLKLNPPGQLRQVPASVWHRFGRITEHQGTTVLVVTPVAMVGGVAVRVEAQAGLDLATLRGTPAQGRARLRFALVRSASGKVARVTAGAA